MPGNILKALQPSFSILSTGYPSVDIFNIWWQLYLQVDPVKTSCYLVISSSRSTVKTSPRLRENMSSNLSGIYFPVKVILSRLKWSSFVCLRTEWFLQDYGWEVFVVRRWQHWCCTHYSVATYWIHFYFRSNLLCDCENPLLGKPPMLTFDEYKLHLNYLCLLINYTK